MERIKKLWKLFKIARKRAKLLSLARLITQNQRFCEEYGLIDLKAAPLPYGKYNGIPIGIALELYKLDAEMVDG